MSDIIFSKAWRIALVVSQFNRVITEKLQEGATEYLIERGAGENCIEVFDVPGAVEIPLVSQRLLERVYKDGRSYYSGVIALGAVIRGETGHYDLVCEQVSQGCLRVSLDYNKPVILGVLTTDSKAQALARVGGGKGHKGREAAQAMLSMLALLDTIEHKELKQCC